MADVFVSLNEKFGNKIRFNIINAEDLADICLNYNITAVPTVLLIKEKKVVGRIDGVNISQLSIECEKLSGNTSNSTASPESLDDRLKKLINLSKVMIFMKGNREQPRCGFSKQLVEIINKHKVDYETFDILSDEEVRQGLKVYSDWPTYPQVYVNGELIGGLDIIKELEKSNELSQTLTAQQ